MSPVRKIIQDLVDKRLWPVAIALVAAIAAVPFVLGGDTEADTTPTVSANAGAAPEKALVEAVAPVQEADRKGDTRDPFRRKTVKEQTAVATIDAGKGAEANPVGGGGATDPKGTAPKVDVTPTVPKAPSKPKAPSGTFDETKMVTLNFGETGNVKRLGSVSQLTPLPNASSPFFVFEGVVRKTGKARFLVSEEVTATGDGKCLPSKDNCQRIDLEVGDTEYFDFDLGEGQTRQYQLDLKSISNGGSQKGAAVRNARSAYRTTVRFGAKESSRSHGIKRLAVLGGATDPAVQYLGVGSDKTSAVFVLGPNTKLLSRAACLDGDACRSIALSWGDKVTVEVQTPGKPWRRYHLQVTDVVRSVKSSGRAAMSARISSAQGGRSVLRRLVGDAKTANALKRFYYSASTGLVARKAEYR